MDLGGLMRACRERAGLSQEKLAELLNRTQSCISKFEKGVKIPDAPTLVKWGEVTQAKEVIIAYIYGLDGLSVVQNLMQLVGG